MSSRVAAPPGPATRVSPRWLASLIADLTLLLGPAAADDSGCSTAELISPPRDPLFAWIISKRLAGCLASRRVTIRKICCVQNRAEGARFELAGLSPGRFKTAALNRSAIPPTAGSHRPAEPNNEPGAVERWRRAGGRRRPAQPGALARLGNARRARRRCGTDRGSPPPRSPPVRALPWPRSSACSPPSRSPTRPGPRARRRGWRWRWRWRAGRSGSPAAASGGLRRRPGVGSLVAAMRPRRRSAARTGLATCPQVGAIPGRPRGRPRARSVGLASRSVWRRRPAVEGAAGGLAGARGAVGGGGGRRAGGRRRVARGRRALRSPVEGVGLETLRRRGAAPAGSWRGDDEEGGARRRRRRQADGRGLGATGCVGRREQVASGTFSAGPGVGVAGSGASVRADTTPSRSGGRRADARRGGVPYGCGVLLLDGRARRPYAGRR